MAHLCSQAYRDLPYVLYPASDDQDDKRHDKAVDAQVARLKKWQALKKRGVHTGTMTFPLESAYYRGAFESSPWAKKEKEPAKTEEQVAELVDDYYLDLWRKARLASTIDQARLSEQPQQSAEEDEMADDSEEETIQSLLPAHAQVRPSAKPARTAQMSLTGSLFSSKASLDSHDQPKSSQTRKANGTPAGSDRFEVLSERGFTQMDIISSLAKANETPVPPARKKLTSFHSATMLKTTSSQNSNTSMPRQTQFPTQSGLENEINAFLAEDLFS